MPSQATAGPAIAIVIPTYRREQVLIDSIAALLPLMRADDELWIVDQSEAHEQSTQLRLQEWQQAGRLHWLRLPRPSIPQAMNLGLQSARAPVVLFLDDDIAPLPALLDAHRAAHEATSHELVAGRVLQPWHVDGSVACTGFAHHQRTEVREFMGGNVSMRREFVLGCGGFDEQFVRVAYCFEREFAARALRNGARILFEPAAGIHHLKASGGGTRVFGDHLRTAGPSHAVGEYYFHLLQPAGRRTRDILRRLSTSIRTRHHLRRPWWIPVTLFAELVGLAWALRLWHAGPKLIARGQA